MTIDIADDMALIQCDLTVVIDVVKQIHTTQLSSFS